MGIPLHTKCLLTKYLKSSYYQRKFSNGRKQASVACFRLVHESKIIRSSPQASFPKFTMLFEDRSCEIYLIHPYVPLQLSISFQVPLNPCSDSCLSKLCVKIWVEELHAVPTKFRNKLLSFYYLKKVMTQNYEREINLIQRA